MDFSYFFILIHNSGNILQNTKFGYEIEFKILTTGISFPGKGMSAMFKRLRISSSTSFWSPLRKGIKKLLFGAVDGAAAIPMAMATPEAAEAKRVSS